MADDGSKVHLFERWPLLLAAVALISAGLALDLTQESTQPYATICLILGSTAFGAFLYAEGARHREWLHHQKNGKSEEDKS
jgi:hypothetical protein